LERQYESNSSKSDRVQVLAYLHNRLNMTVPFKCASDGGLDAWRSANAAELKRHGICVLDSYQMAAFLENHMSSFNSVLQSRSLGGSWRDAEDALADQANMRRHRAGVQRGRPGGGAASEG
jgi:hypothetical protein